MKNLASRQFLPRSAAQSDLYQTYEQDRRARLLRVMLPAAAAIFVLVSIILAVRLLFTHPIPWGIWVLSGFGRLARIPSIPLFLLDRDKLNWHHAS